MFDVDPHVDHRANGDGDACQRHDVGIDVEQLHGDKRHQHGGWQSHRDDQTGSNMQQKQHHHDDRDQRFVSAPAAVPSPPPMRTFNGPCS